MDMGGWVPSAFPLLGSSPSLQQTQGYSSACLEHLWFISPETAVSCRPGKCIHGQSATSRSRDTRSWQCHGAVTPQPEQHKSRLRRGASSLAEPQRKRRTTPTRPHGTRRMLPSVLSSALPTRAGELGTGSGTSWE